jgi:hypothetical protein
MSWNIIVIVALVISFVITAFFSYWIPKREALKADLLFRGFDRGYWGKAALFFILMLIGMLAREAYNMLVAGKNFNWVSLAIAAIVSPIVFGGVYGQLGTLEIDVSSTTLAFQNGFFWNSIFEGIGPTTS